jgi:hypothetical protein
MAVRSAVSKASVVFHKCDGDPKWIRDSETFPIPVSAVLPEQDESMES